MARWDIEAHSKVTPADFYFPITLDFAKNGPLLYLPSGNYYRTLPRKRYRPARNSKPPLAITSQSKAWAAAAATNAQGVQELVAQQLYADAGFLGQSLVDMAADMRKPAVAALPPELLLLGAPPCPPHIPWPFVASKGGSWVELGIGRGARR